MPQNNLELPRQRIQNCFVDFKISFSVLCRTGNENYTCTYFAGISVLYKIHCNIIGDSSSARKPLNTAVVAQRYTID